VKASPSNNRQHVLALDQGTTSSRAIVFRRDGSIAGSAQQELPQYFPQPGWVEHDPEEIWQTTLATARGALTAAGIGARDVTAIGIANQRETTLLWERRTARPLARAIVWQDRRTSGICSEFEARGMNARVVATTGLLLDPYFSATKIGWLLDRVPNARERAERGEICFGTVDSWLVRRLTGDPQHLTDVTNASRTLLFDIHAFRWSPELLETFRIPAAILPAVLPCAGEYGSTLDEHFGSPIPIAGVAGDQQAALVGQCCFEAGSAKCTYGTGSFAMLNTGGRPAQSSNGLLTTVAFALNLRERRYALEGAVFTAGAAVQWLRDGLRIITDAADSESAAREVADNGGVWFVPAFTGLGAPYWDSGARGTIVGLTRGTQRGHIVRAALEAIAFQNARVIEAMQRDAGVRLAEVRVDGGGSRNGLLMQLQADVLGVPVVRPRMMETTALGAAYLAGLGRGVWEDLDALRALRPNAERFEPAMTPARREAAFAEWERAVSRSRGWIA
jgi:glycerol kinase